MDVISENDPARRFLERAYGLRRTGAPPDLEAQGFTKVVISDPDKPRRFTRLVAWGHGSADADFAVMQGVAVALAEERETLFSLFSLSGIPKVLPEFPGYDPALGAIRWQPGQAGSEARHPFDEKIVGQIEPSELAELRELWRQRFFLQLAKKYAIMEGKEKYVARSGVHLLMRGETGLVAHASVIDFSGRRRGHLEALPIASLLHEYLVDVETLDASLRAVCHRRIGAFIDGFAHPMYIQFAPDNAAALGCYERHGFQLIDVVYQRHS